MTPRLSKSRIQSGRQCHKRLWLELHHPGLARWEPAFQARLDEGTRFGELARDLLGGGELITADHLHLQEAFDQTRAALERPGSQRLMLFEPAFCHEDVRVRVDAFERNEHAEHGDTLIEVKSTASVKDEHLWDCAIQTWVARGAGRPVRQVVLAHVNTQFVYSRTGDYGGLLKQVDITAAVEALQGEIPRIVRELKQVASGHKPMIATGRHCTTPYGCPFLTYCRSEEPAPSAYPVALLPRAHALVGRLHDQGYRDLRDVPPGALVNPLHQTIAQATRSGQAWVSERLRSVLAAVPYPRLFLDFETVRFVIPPWLGTRPFQALPFQFSCHRLASDGTVSHVEFIDLTGQSPIDAFVEHLLEAVAGGGPIMVWNQGFEASRLRELAEMVPASRDALTQVMARLVDLLPLYRTHYYHRDMRGSWSIKAVLATVAPNLAYGDLEIANGVQAQAAYAEAIAGHTSLARRAQIRSELLAYCQRDTLAMMRLMGHHGADIVV